MADLAQLLSGRGLEIFPISLDGHGTETAEQTSHLDPEERRLASFRAVTRSGWLEQVQREYVVARRRAQALDVPLFLFAPALTTRWYTRAVRCLSPFPNLVLPSLAPVEFAANRGTPVAAYNALFQAIASVRSRSMLEANVPCVVFIDPEDELVSYRALRALRDAKKLDQWSIHPLRRQLRRGKTDYHHLIVIEDRVGSESWRRVGDEIEQLVIGVNVACSRGLSPDGTAR
jgi:hypothetical protein